MSFPRQRQAIFWLLTIPLGTWEPPTELSSDLSWIGGQQEIGERTGYAHWQVVCAFKKKRTHRQACSYFGSHCNAEPTRSSAANDYVHKEATSVPGTRFEFGAKPFRRNSSTDWEQVWEAAKAGELMAIPANVRVVSYRTLRTIASDHDTARPMERECWLFWGPTQTGKSRRAWDEAGMDAYCKDPCSKFWCGYQDETNVVIDEFRGLISISHFLRWLDRYPVRVEIKGSSKPLVATRIWLTSNLDPDQWWPDADPLTRAAVLRRINIIDFNETANHYLPEN